jgi:hypothetical protein
MEAYGMLRSINNRFGAGGLTKFDLDSVSKSETHSKAAGATLRSAVVSMYRQFSVAEALTSVLHWVDSKDGP